MKKILVIVGTRPEAIKMAPVIKLLQENNSCQAMVCSTGQHSQMVQEVMDIFQLEIDHTLNVMDKGQSLAALTSKLYSQLDILLTKVQPQWVLVHGDTTSAQVGSMVAYYHHCKVAHIEAGLRTQNKWGPFPEEINRQIIARVTDLHFAPTLSAQENLIKEGVDATKIIITGNTIVDSLKLVLNNTQPTKNRTLAQLNNKKYILLTIHRRENKGAPLDQILTSLEQFIVRHPDVELVFVLHPNPVVSEPIRNKFEGKPKIHLLSSQPYDQFILLLSEAYLIITDSGGIQEEAPSLGKPVVILRQETERKESIEGGLSILVGHNTKQIHSTLEKLLSDKEYYATHITTDNPYGDGLASQRIVNRLISI